MTGSGTYNLLSPHELHQWLTENREFYLIDVLPDDQFQKVHLPDARNACVFQVTFLDMMSDMTEDKNGVIVLYGSSARSMDTIKAAEKLQHAGFKNLYILEGGLETWRSAGLPLEGEETDAADDLQTLLKLKDRTCRIDTELSVIVWTGRNPNSTHYGNLQFSGGEISVREGIITGIFDIDMHSITNINLQGDELQPVLIDHLKSDDFFLVEQFPSATFKIKNGKPAKEPYITHPNYEIKRTLELRGTRAEQNFMATVAMTADNSLAVEAHFDIDRTRWGVIYGSTRFFEHLGLRLVFDLISIQMRRIAD